MKYIKGYDTLRAISIIFVILSHIGMYNLIPNSFFLKDRFWKLISGTTGVYVFFTLSGFLITLILIAEIKRKGRIDFIKFFARRFLRLLPPLIIFYLIIGTLMHFKMIHTYKVGLLYSMFYVYNYLPREFLTPELVHTWSLAVEEQYYLFWPFILNFFRKKIHSVLYITLIIICVGVLILYVLLQSHLGDSYVVGRWFFPASIPIFIGSFFAILISLNLSNVTGFLTHKRNVLVGVMFYLFPLYGIYNNYTAIFQSIGIGIFLVLIYFHQNSKTVVFLDNKYLSYIGKISYGLYVYQGLFLRTGPGGKLWFQQFPNNLIFTFVFAIVSFHFLEKPILKLKNKFY